MLCFYFIIFSSTQKIEKKQHQHFFSFKLTFITIHSFTNSSSCLSLLHTHSLSLPIYPSHTIQNVVDHHNVNFFSKCFFPISGSFLILILILSYMLNFSKRTWLLSHLCVDCNYAISSFIRVV